MVRQDSEDISKMEKLGLTGQWLTDKLGSPPFATPTLDSWSTERRDAAANFLGNVKRK